MSNVKKSSPKKKKATNKNKGYTGKNEAILNASKKERSPGRNYKGMSRPKKDMSKPKDEFEQVETLDKKAKPQASSAKYDKNDKSKFADAPKSKRVELTQAQKDEIKKNACPHAKKCGGCQLQNMSYEQQLSYKQAICIRNLKRFGMVDEIVGMDDPKHYRNKVQAAFGTTRRGQIISGVYQSSSHRIVSVDSCMIEDQIADEIIVHIRHMLKAFKLTAYNEDTGKGFLRHVLVKRGFKTNQVMVVLVTSSAIFTGKNNFIKELVRKFPMIETIVQNINEDKTSLVLGRREIVLYGDGYIQDELCNLKFRISPKSFYQINPVQTEKLYAKAMQLAKLNGTQTVLDAYCGIGTIGLVASTRAKNVIGVEINDDAVLDAIANAKLNQRDNIWFYCADAGEFMVELAEQNQKIDVVFMDPPRSGSDENFLSSVVKLSPKRVVYISCDVSTQARDLAYLVKKGYKVERIAPFDMFSYTSHVECIVSLCK